MEHRLLPAARERLTEIWEYTDEKWGEEQADAYLTGFFAHLDDISFKPHKWKRLKTKEHGAVYFSKYEHHFVFFRQISCGALGVITILHESMNLPDRVTEAFDINER
ncbi:MAG: type II toxin-antitoxin system RelE/ParE family toxin [Verrucomicrobiota bacterium]